MDPQVHPESAVLQRALTGPLVGESSAVPTQPVGHVDEPGPGTRQRTVPSPTLR